MDPESPGNITLEPKSDDTTYPRWCCDPLNPEMRHPQLSSRQTGSIASFKKNSILAGELDGTARKVQYAVVGGVYNAGGVSDVVV